MLQKTVRGSVQDGPAQRLLAPGLPDEPLVQKRLNGIVALDPAHLLHLALGDGLAVGDDSQRFHGGLRKGLALHGLKQAFYIGRVFRARLHAQMVAIAVYGHAAAFAFALQLLHGMHDLHLAHLQRLRQVGHSHRLAGDKENRFQDLRNFIRLHPFPPPDGPAPA